VTPRAAEAGAAYARLADGYARDGDHPLAEQYFRRALHEGFVLGEVHVGLARTLAALNRLDEAEDHLRRALAMDASSDDALDELAALYLQGGRVGEALETMRRRLEARADAQGHLVYAGLVERIGLLTDAEQHYRAALAQPSTALEAASGLGVLLARRGRLHEAEPLLRAAADGLVCAASSTNHAHVLSELGRVDEADGRYREALAADPDCGEAQLGLGELYARRGELGRADVARRRAFRLAPDLRLSGCSDL
jgi:tetratricopeptide (TPR) repeat protein